MSISERAMVQRSPAQQQQPKRIVTEDDVHAAVDFLQHSAAKLGAAKGRLSEAGHMIKHVEALMFKGSSAGNVEARKADAKTSARWLAAIKEETAATIEYETLKGEREARIAQIEVWRSESATLRGIRL